MTITQLIASLIIVSACTLLAVYTEVFKNLFIQLILAGFVALVLSDDAPTLPSLIWAMVFGLLYVVCVDLMVDTLKVTATPHSAETVPPDPTPQPQEQDIHDVFEFESIGGESP